MSFDVLIVGQGLAGSFLAWDLLKRAKRVLIIDQDHAHSSSVISPGIINPLTGQRLVITPQFDLFFVDAMSAYEALGQQFGMSFFESKPIVRVLRGPDEVERCRQLSSNPLTSKYIQSFQPARTYGKDIHDPFGSVVINCGGHCLGGQLLAAMKLHFKQAGVLVNQRFFYDELIIKENGISWHELEFKYVIFAEGYQAQSNPWFKWVPFNHVKGEILQVQLEGVKLPSAILSQSKWCVPLGNAIWSIGSNYNRDQIDCEITDTGAEEIIQGIKDFIPAHIKTISHHAAVRPVVIDQMPVLGMHPHFSSVGIFNGLGSKGFLTAPFYARAFGRYLTRLKPLAADIDCARFRNTLQK